MTYEPTVLPLVVRAGAGSVRDSLSVLDQLLSGAGPEGLTYERTVALLGYTDDSLLDEMVDALSAGDGAAAFGTVDRVVQGGHDPRRFAADLLDRLRDLIILGAVPGAGQTGLLDAPADRLETMTGQAGRFGQAELARAAEILSEGLIQMRGATSPRLLLELMCAQVLLPGASTGEKALAARLERLERRLEGLAAEGPVPGPVPAWPPRPGRPRRVAPRTARAAEPARAGPGAGVRAGQASVRGAAGQPGEPGAPRAAARQTGSGARGTRQREARRDPAAGRPRRSAAAPPRPGATGRPRRAPPRLPGPGSIDADTLRQRWPDILEAVKRERRVAWMLLSAASVDSMEGGVLTVAFAGEGQARGFAASGHDQVLTGVLASMLGLNVRVRAAVGTGSGAHGGRPASRGSASGSPRRGPSGARRRCPGTGGRAGRRRGPAGRLRRWPAHRMRCPAAQGPLPAGSRLPPAARAVPPGAVLRADGLRAAPARAPGGRRHSAANGPAAAADPAEEWPDDAGPAGAPARPAWSSSSGSLAARSSRKSRSRDRPAGRAAYSGRARCSRALTHALRAGPRGPGSRHLRPTASTDRPELLAAHREGLDGSGAKRAGPADWCGLGTRGGVPTAARKP